MLKNVFTLWNPFIDIEAICKLCLLIDSKVYGFFSKLYSFYIDLASRRIFSQEAISSLTNRIYIFVGVIALFFIAYSLLKTLVDPEKGLKDGGGKLVFNIASSLIMLLVIPVVFELGYKVQEIIIEENIIGNIFLGTDQELEENSQNIKYTINEDEMTKLDESENINYSKQELSKEILRVYGNQTAYLVLNAFLYPVVDDFHVDASEEFNLDSGIKSTAAGATVAITVTAIGVIALEIATSPATGGATLAAIPATLKAFAGSIALAGAVGGAVGAGINLVGYEITAKEFTWTDAQIGMVYGGNFDYITAFSEAIDAGNMEYVPIISTVCGIILVYMMLGFCIDLGIRAAKLAMYEMLAPIPILLRIVPGQSKVFNNWLKEVLLTFFEVLVRIGILFGISYLISLVPHLTIFSDTSGGAFAKAVIVLGLVAFIKEAPKLLSDVIGIKSSSKIGFNLKDKLAATGALTAAAAIGGGATAFLRNGATGVTNAWAKKKAGDKKGAWKAVGVGVLSALAGGVSGAVRGGKAAASAKSFEDVKNSASKGATASTDARVKREKYKATHGDGTFLGDLKGVALGHISDATTKVGGFVGVKNLADIKRENSDMAEITSTRDSFDSAAESLILKELGKGKTVLKLDRLGNDLNFAELKAKQAVLQRAQQTGQGLQAAQEEYDKELKNLVYELQNASLKSAKLWDSRSADVRAKLSSVRTEAIKYRGAIRSNISLDVVKDAGLNGSMFADDVDYTLGVWVDSNGNIVPAGTPGARMDNNLQITALEKAIKIRKGENDIEIATREQKQEENK